MCVWGKKRQQQKRKRGKEDPPNISKEAMDFDKRPVLLSAHVASVQVYLGVYSWNPDLNMIFFLD